ncbi:RodZ domain-containing protein [Spectribacter hydrogenooxidans]|uniref:DUF4115 domain-containing protein n=1 Tax=Spectribacter hydrogenoxidans TaxID=3075608 RepID=A0ABU3BZ36_9GAMM|nr:RodZ domain-containing protein [Salinisphaera sp. W335]MDT0634371.1 DUF4115 domain-containing protein [Salinisphaera sp. W335]
MIDDSQEDGNGQADSAPEADPAPRKRVSPGHLLRSAREAKDLSLDEVTAQTMLARGTVEALENNDFDRLSQPVFVRGYYRKCAKALGVPEDEVMAAYSEWTGVPGPSPASPGQVDVIPQDVTPGGRRVVGAVAVILLLGLIAVFGWQVLPGGGNGDGEMASTAPASDQPASVSTDEESSIPTAESTIRTPPIEGAAESPSVPTDPVTDETVAGNETPEPAETPERPADDTTAGSGGDGAGDTRLVLRFEDRSWVEVRDASGNRLIQGIIGGGNMRVVDGDPPYRVVLGFAPGVTITMGERTLFTGEDAGPDRTARFTVQADGSIQ